MAHRCPEEGPCETCELIAKREAMWAAGPPRKPGITSATVETEHGPVQVPATIDPVTQRDIALEAAGYERDPATGEWGHGTWSAVGGP